MSCKYSLLFLFLCGFTALSVSEICNPQLPEGKSCTLKLGTKKYDKSNEIKWVHLSSDALIHWKNGKMKKITPGLKMEEDGSLTFESVSLKNSGTYTFNVFNGEGTEIEGGRKEINVYAQAPKPIVTFDCKGRVVTCNIINRTDLTVSWYEEDKIIQNEKNPKLLLTPAQLQENKPYSCSVSNPVSEEKSDSITGSCTGATGGGSGPRMLFGFDFWIMVGILSGGGALLLLLICVLVTCACRSCKQKKKQEEEEDELRLRVFHDEAQNGTARSKHTARGQPAPPTPQEDPCPETPTLTQTQPKAQTRGRPPPPPEDDEDPPPLPRPRNKQHRKKHEEPYRPME